MTRNTVSQTMLSEIIKLNQQGLFNYEIAEQVGVDRTTVARHLKKVGLSSPRPRQYDLERVDEKHARCRICNEIKIIDCFEKYGRYKTVYRSYCNNCKLKRTRDSLNKNIKRRLRNIYSRKRSRVRDLGIVFSISWEEFEQQFDAQNGKCFYTDVEMTWRLGKGQNRDNSTRLSIDRIKPDLGYISGNVVFCAARINTVKNDFTLEEMQQWMPEWYKRATQFLDSSTS